MVLLFAITASAQAPSIEGTYQAYTQFFCRFERVG
jgi:hypothetical protein